MKKKNFIYIAALSVLTSFSFVGCSDDEEPWVGLPTGSVTELSFSNDNSNKGGTLTWKADESLKGVSKYVIYGSIDGKTKEKITEVDAKQTSYTINNLDNAVYLMVYAANQEGESATCATIKARELNRLYILNSGKFGNNNASLYMYDIRSKKVFTDFFAAQNERGLGDTAQDMIVYGNKMYIAIYGESTIEVTDLEAKSIKQIKTEGQPRALIADGGKVYATYYNGYVARLDTASLNVDAKVKVGRNPEQMAIANNKIYVANSGGMDYNTPAGYDKTVSVIDIPSFTETKKIDVVLNPTCLQSDNNGKVYLVSMGNYADVLNTMQVIDSNTDNVTKLTSCPNATEMAIVDNTLYSFYSQYDANWNTIISYAAYNTQTDKTEVWTKDTEINKPYKLVQANGNIFVTESDYKNNGDTYCFDTTGKLQYKIGSGLNPIRVVFANN